MFSCLVLALFFGRCFFPLKMVEGTDGGVSPLSHKKIYKKIFRKIFIKIFQKNLQKISELTIFKFVLKK